MRKEKGSAKQRNRQHKTRKPKFEGQCNELKGHVFDYVNPAQAQADKFYTAIEKIATFIGSTYDGGHEVRRMIKSLEPITIPKPEKLSTDATETERIIWQCDKDEYFERKKRLQENMESAYWLIWGQCSQCIQLMVEEFENYDEMKKNYDIIALIKAIRAVTFGFDERNDLHLSFVIAKRRFFLFHQTRGMSDYVYLRKFKSLVSVVEDHGGSLSNDPVTIELALKEEDEALTMDTASPTQLSKAEQVARERFLACALLMGADRNRHGRLLGDLEHDYAMGKDTYPKTISKAFQLLVNYIE